MLRLLVGDCCGVGSGEGGRIITILKFGNNIPRKLSFDPRRIISEPGNY